MFPVRALRTSTPALRQFSQRRLASSSITENAFNRERQAVKDHAAATSGLWRRLSIYVNAWRLWDEHWEHKSHEPPIEERTEYPYMNIRTKNYFWGDGDKTLFWNPKVNYHKKADE